MTDPQIAGPQNARRVLIAEDHPDPAFVMVHLRESLDFEIRAVRSGELAYPAARAFLPHVVLLDLGLPIKDGYEVAELMRCDASLAETRLITILGFGPDVFPELACRVQFDHHFVKPVDLDRLIPLLGDWAPCRALPDAADDTDEVDPPLHNA